MQLKYCQKLDIEADPIHKLKPLIKKLFFDFKINEISLYNAIKILPKMGFRSGIRNYVYVSYGITCWIQHLERQKPQKAPKGIVFQR